MFDVVTIGSATQDIFIECDCGKIVDIRGVSEKANLLCFDYGSKLEVDRTASDIGGGAVNAAANFANLGLKTSTIIKIGNDLNAEAIMQRLKSRNVDDSLVIKNEEYNTGFSVILTSFEGDRTVLAHRGANSRIRREEINMNAVKNSKWLYIAPMSGESNQVLDELAEYAEANGVNLAFNPGTTSIKKGLEYLKKILVTAEILIMNKEEASLVTGVFEKPKTKHDNEETIKNGIPLHIIKLLNELKSYNPKIVVVTDGKNGVYAFDGEYFYHALPFPAKVLSTLGAGDAFASTFTASIIKTGWDIQKSILNASINAASIIQTFGAQNGFKTFEEIEKTAENNPDFKVEKIEKDFFIN